MYWKNNKNKVPAALVIKVPVVNWYKAISLANCGVYNPGSDRTTTVWTP